MDATIKPNSRQATLLLFIGDAGPTDLDPVRLMKGLFLMSATRIGRC